MAPLSSPPSGPVHRASGAASGRLVVAAPASDSETVNYSSKQRSRSVPWVIGVSKSNTESLTYSQNARRDVCHQPLWVNSPVHLVKRPLPALLPRWVCRLFTLCGSLRGGMRKVFTPAAWKTVRYNRGKLGPTTAWTVTTSLTSLLLPLFTLCRINININTRCALRWARVARVAAPRAALVRLRKNGPTSALGRGEGVCAKRSFSTGRGAWSCARARVLLTGLSITPKSANSFAPSFKGSSCFITE